MALDSDVVEQDRAEQERIRVDKLDGNRQRRTSSRDLEFGDKLAKRVVREGGRSFSRGIEAPLKLLGYSDKLMSKYGVRQVDNFLFGFTTITTFSVVGIILALLALIVLDIRWVIGKFSHRIPPMLIFQSMYLAILNLIVIFAIFIILILFFAAYCIASEPARMLANYVTFTAFSKEFFSSCLY